MKYAFLNSRFSKAIEPPTQDTNIVFSSVTTNSMTISWTNNGAEKHLVVMRESSAVDDVPIDGVVYSANSSFGTGEQVGIFNYVVYKGSGNSVNVTNLATNKRYYVRVFAVNGAEGIGYANYNTNTTTGNPANQATSTLSDLNVTIYSGSNLTSFGQGNSEKQYGNEYANTSTVINSSLYDEVQMEMNVTVATASPNTPRGYPGWTSLSSPPYYEAGKVIGTGSGGQAMSMSSTGVKTTSWITIPAGAKSTATRFLLLENGGDGSSPAINSLIIRMRQIPVP